MRAIIVEIRGRQAAALGDDGMVYLIKAGQHAVGEKIDLSSQKCRFRWKKPLTWAACVAVLVATATTGVYAAYEPYSYVSLDTASSVEYTLNRFDQVLDVCPVDEDSAFLAKTLHAEVPKFSHIDKALAHTVDAMYADGSLTGSDDDLLLVGVSAKGDHKTQQLKEHLGEKLGEKRPDGQPHPPSEVIPSNQKHRRIAQELGTSSGKLELMERLYGDQNRPSKTEAKALLKQPAGDLMRQAGKQPAPPPDDEHAPPTNDNPPPDAEHAPPTSGSSSLDTTDANTMQT